MAIAPDVEDTARRLGSRNRLKRVNRWYSSTLKGIDGAKTCFANFGVIFPAESVESRIRRCLFCFFSEMKDSDWLIPVTIVPFSSSVLERRGAGFVRHTFEFTASVIGASSSDPRTYSETTVNSFLTSSSTSSTTLAAIYTC